MAAQPGSPAVPVTATETVRTSLSYFLDRRLTYHAGSFDGDRSYAPSIDSRASVPSISPFADPGIGSNEPYPAWSVERQIPMSTEEIEDIFLDLTQKFGFQRDSMRNTVRE